MTLPLLEVLIAEAIVFLGLLTLLPELPSLPDGDTNIESFPIDLL